MWSLVSPLFAADESLSTAWPRFSLGSLTSFHVCVCDEIICYSTHIQNNLDVRPTLIDVQRSPPEWSKLGRENGSI